MTLNNAARNLAVRVVLSFGLCYSLYAQTTTTDCTLNGNTANCTSTDDSALKAQQAERDRENYQIGQKIGTALDRVLLAQCRRSPSARGCANTAIDILARTGTIPAALTVT